MTVTTTKAGTTIDTSYTNEECVEFPFRVIRVIRGSFRRA